MSTEGRDESRTTAGWTGDPRLIGGLVAGSIPRARPPARLTDLMFARRQHRPDFLVSSWKDQGAWHRASQDQQHRGIQCHNHQTDFCFPLNVLSTVQVVVGLEGFVALS